MRSGKGKTVTMNLQIIHEDNDIILCRKPAGVATQTKRLGQQDMESLLKNYRAKNGETPYIGVVHRLDQPVEGIMVFAKNQRAAAELSRQIQGHMIGKYYYAVSACAPEKPQGVLEDYLATDKKTNVTVVVNPDAVSKDMTKFDIAMETKDEIRASLQGVNSKDVKKAKLEYRVIESNEKETLFDVKLYTGRQHQIRVQMAHMGCPLVGDSKYGNCKWAGMTEDAAENVEKNMAGVRKMTLALCSYRLQFTHPATGKPMDFSIEPQGEAFHGFFLSYPKC